MLHTDHCPENKLDNYVRPLIAISQERVARGDTPLFPSHMWDGSAISLQRNLTIAAELLAMGAKTHTILEVEIGVVGSEEDGITGEINDKLYTPRRTTSSAPSMPSVIGTRAVYLLATFGNVHGVTNRTTCSCAQRFCRWARKWPRISWACPLVPSHWTWSSMADRARSWRRSTRRCRTEWSR